MNQAVRSLLSVTLSTQISEYNTNLGHICNRAPVQFASSFSLYDNKTGIILNLYQGN